MNSANLLPKSGIAMFPGNQDQRAEAALGEHPTPEHILEIGLGFWASKTLLSAVELGLFTKLARKPESLEGVQNRIGLHPRSSRDFLDALVALGLLERSNGYYSNTQATDFFLDKKKPSYIGGVLEMASQRLYGHWRHLTEGLRTGLPQNEVRGGGQPVFQTLYADPERLKGFLSAMTGISHGSALAVYAAFKSVVSVHASGEGLGSCPVKVLALYSRSCVDGPARTSCLTFSKHALTPGRSTWRWIRTANLICPAQTSKSFQTLAPAGDWD